MRLATLIIENKKIFCICYASGFFPIKDLNRHLNQNWPESMDHLIGSGRFADLTDWFEREGNTALVQTGDLAITIPQPHYAPLYRHPPKIWGIGLNYVEHAKDLSETAPTSAPASFMKPSTAIIGHGDTIEIPRLSQKTTAEAELGIILGRRCKDVPQEKWLEVVAGFTTILDMTAEDILRKNPRYLTMCKSFDTFFSFGPQLITPDEVGDVMRLRVSTIINGRIHAENTVDHMTFPPDVLIAYHSKMMTLLPGDIISSGTPGAVHIRHGDQVECRITGFEPLWNRVVDLKQGQ